MSQTKRPHFSIWILSLVLYFTFLAIAMGAEYCNQTSNGMVCYPCYYRCKSCSGLSIKDCSQCTKQYILFENKCYSCGQNCYSCKKINDTSNLNSSIIQNQCETCIEGYYLSQSTGKCIKCPQGAQTCTLSAIQSCKDQYFEENGVCSKCPQNCLKCMDSTSCQTCLNYFYLDPSTGVCAPCLLKNCLVCDTPSTCSNCEDGYSGSDCSEVCPQNCAICYSGICFVCKSSSYLLNGECQLSRLLCKTTDTYSGCYQCIDDLSYLSEDGTCLPSFTVHDQNRLIYLTAINNLDSFSSNIEHQNKSISDSKTIEYCKEPFSIYMMKSSTGIISIASSIDPAYKVRVTGQGFYGSPSFTLTMSTNNQSLQSQLNLNINSTQAQCGNETYFIFNFAFQFGLNDKFNSSNQNLVVSLSINNFLNASLYQPFGIVDLYFELFRCLVRNCLMCKSAYTCQSCIFPYRLQNNECLRICEEGYYFTEVDSKITCTLDCLKGYYAVRQDYTCKKCIWPCIQCEDINVCLKCYNSAVNSSFAGSNQSYFLSNSSCVSQCPSRYFADLQSYTCEECIFPCNQCLNFSACTSCQLGYLNRDLLKCVVSCPQGQYSDFLQLTCESCAFPCKSCEYSSQTCIECSQPYFLYEKNNSCLQTCPAGYTNVSDSMRKCQECQFPCKTCEGRPQSCFSCLKGYFYQSSCLAQCPKGFYESTGVDLNNLCSACKNNCLECQDETICVSCVKGFKFNVQQKSCVNGCPKGSYESVDTTVNESDSSAYRCNQCVPPCLDCSNETYCLSCTGLLFLNHLGQCLLECPLGTYIFYNSTIEERQCQTCPSNCINCVSLSNCYECKDGWLLWEGICYTQCPSKTFPNQNGYKYCELCEYPCLQCLNEYKCLSCVLGFLYEGTNSKCSQFCLDGYFQNSVESTCLECDLECETCVGGSDNCLSCSIGYYYDNSTGKCSQQCSPGTYYSRAERRCMNCQWPCKTCQSFSSCLSCYENSQTLPNGTNLSASNVLPQSILYLSHCISECQSGYFETLEPTGIVTCARCIFPCQQCEKDASSCRKCRLPSFTLTNGTSISKNLINSGCLTRCPVGFYGRNYQCVMCEEPCKQCQSVDQCVSCIGGWYLLEGECYEECPYHYFSSNLSISSNSNPVQITGYCVSCDDKCRQCRGSESNCTECSNNNFLLGNDCFEQCPAKYYPSSSLMMCLKCQLPCDECYSQFYCKTCLQGYYFQAGRCTTQCTKKYYVNPLKDRECTRCKQPCEKCISEFQCLECVFGYYYYDQNKSCVVTCPPRMYPYRLQYITSSLGSNSNNSSTDRFKGLCLSCSELCMECASYSICTSCNSTSEMKFLEDGKCQSSCSDGYYPLNLGSNDGVASNPTPTYVYQCLKCKEGCLSCSSYDACSKCVSSYLFESQCIRDCPAYYYGSGGFVCEKCAPPCKECYNEYNCINCVEGYYLYQNVCVRRCPLTHWTDLQNKVCLLHCPEHTFMYQQNKTCLVQCPKFYSKEGYCLNVCSLSQGQVINSTMGCQICQTGCDQILSQLNYRIEQIVLDGRLILILKFGTPMQINPEFSIGSLFNTKDNTPLSQNLTQRSLYQVFSAEENSFAQTELRMTFLSQNSLSDDLQAASAVSINDRQNQQNQSRAGRYQSLTGEQPQLEKNGSLRMVSLISNQTQPSSSPWSPTLLSLLSNSIWMETPDLAGSFSGYLNYNISTYLGLLSSKLYALSPDASAQYLPMQVIQQKQTRIKSFNSARKMPVQVRQLMKWASVVLSFTVLVLVLINLVLDNLKSQFHLIDFAQNLFLLFWLSDGIELGINDFLYNFNISSFVPNFGPSFQSPEFYTLMDSLSIEHLSKCSPKQLIYSNACQFDQLFMFLSIPIAVFVAFILSMKLIAHWKPVVESKLKIEHRVVYSHINNFYWLFVSPLFLVSAQSLGFNQSSTKSLVINLILMIICWVITLVIAYQVLKNIFNCSFQQKSLFWGLKCHRLKNEQGNIHFLLLMIRKSIMLVFLVLTFKSQNQQLVFFFLIVLISIIILSNMLANSPFKKKNYQRTFVASEILILLFYLGIQIYIANVKKFDEFVFVLYNSSLLLIALVVLVLNLSVALVETFKIGKKKYELYKSLGQNSPSSEGRSSSCDTVSKAGDYKVQNSKSEKDFTMLPATLSKEKKNRITSKNTFAQNLQSTETNQARINNSEVESSGQNQIHYSSGFQLHTSEQNSEFQKPAKYLIKVEKKIDSDHED